VNKCSEIKRKIAVLKKEEAQASEATDKIKEKVK
jgi:hypothetical protein